MTPQSLGVCTALYEAGRPFLDACMRSIVEAVRVAGVPTTVLAAIDDLAEPAAALAEYTAHLPISVFHAAPRATTADVQGTMLAAGAASAHDVLVFVDMDDMLLPEGIGRHLAALDTVDISYGDLVLIDQSGARIGGTLFEKTGVPDHVDDVTALLTRNFLGMSNTAVRRKALASMPPRVPRHLTATDWWLFTSLIRAGHRAARTTGPVGYYRQHTANVLGADPARQKETLRKRCRIVREHYAVMTGMPGVSGLDREVETVEHALDIDDPRLDSAIGQASQSRSAWYEDVFRVAAVLSGRGQDVPEREDVSRC